MDGTRICVDGNNPMHLSRNIALAAHFVLDECVPPVVRDSRWFMWLPYRLLFGRKSEVFFGFKETAHALSEDDFRRAYGATRDVHIKRETDLNRACIDRLMTMAKGTTVLDIACGRGFLAGLLASSGFETTGVDMHVSAEVRSRYPEVIFQESNIEALPYKDNAFDTVVCAHTLEHVRFLEPAIAELRRVTARRLMVIVPKQRNYRYTFDLHLHFFPYPHDLMQVMGRRGTAQSCDVVGGDLFYVEDFDQGVSA